MDTSWHPVAVDGLWLRFRGTVMPLLEVFMALPQGLDIYAFFMGFHGGLHHAPPCAFMGLHGTSMTLSRRIRRYIDVIS